MVEKRTFVCLALLGLIIALAMPLAAAADGCPPENPNCNIEPPQSVEVNPNPLHADGSPVELPEPGMLSPQLIPMPLPRSVDPLPLPAGDAPSFETLPVPMRYQDPDDATCGVHALGMALSGLGEDAPSSAAIQGFLEDNGMMYDFGTGVEELAYAAQSLGYEGSLPFHGWTLDDVRAELSAGRSVVVSLGANPGQNTGTSGEGNPGHFVTVTGISPDGKHVAYNDPTSGSEIATVEEFSHLWAMQGNSGVMVRRTIPAGESDYRPLVAIMATLMAIISQTPWGMLRTGIGGRRNLEDRESPVRVIEARPRVEAPPRPAPVRPRPTPRTPPAPPRPSPRPIVGREGPMRGIATEREGIREFKNEIIEQEMAPREGTVRPAAPSEQVPSAPDSGPPAAKTLWNEHAVNTVTTKGIEQAHIDQTQVDEAHRLSREVIKATGGAKLTIEDMAAIAQAYGVHLERHDGSQLVAALNYINAAPSPDQQQERLRKALINFQVLERGMPRLERQETLDLMWGATRLPGHAVQSMNSNQLANTFQEVSGAISQPGQHQLQVGKHVLKMDVSETNTVTSTSTKKPSFLSKVGSALKKVGSIALAAASFIPGPIGIVARVAGAIVGAIKGIKERSVLGTIAGIASAVTAGASQLVGKVAETVSKVASTVSRVVKGVQSGISAVKNGSILGAIAGFGSAVAGGLQDLTSKTAETIGRVASTVSRAARGVETAITAARMENPSMLFGAIAGVAGSLAGTTADASGRFASTMNQVATWARRGQTAVTIVEQAKNGDFTGALVSGTALAAEIDGPNGSNGEDEGESVLDQVALWAGRADQAVGIVGAIRDGDISQALWSGSALAAELSKNGDVEDAHQVIDRVRALEAAIRSDDPLAIREAFLGLTDAVRQTVENVRERHFAPEIMDLPVLPVNFPELLAVVPSVQMPTEEIDSSGSRFPGLLDITPQVSPGGVEGPRWTYSHEVYIAQTMLNRLGENLQTDGLLGPKTTAALERFQEDQGLDVTGLLDSVTMQALVNVVMAIDSAPVEGGSFAQLEISQRRAHDTIFKVREYLDSMPGGTGWPAWFGERDLCEMVDRLEQTLDESQAASTAREARDADSLLRTIMRAIEYKLKEEYGIWAEIGLQQMDAVRVGLGFVETGADVVIEVAAPPWLKYGYDFAKTTGVGLAQGDGLGWALFKGVSSSGVKRFLNTKFLDPFLKSDRFKKELMEAAVVEMGEAIPGVMQELSKVWNTNDFQERAYQIVWAQAGASAQKLASGLAASMLADTSSINVEDINKRLQQSLNVDVSRLTEFEKQIALAGLFKTSIFEGIKQFFESGLGQVFN